METTRGDVPRRHFLAAGAGWSGEPVARHEMTRLDVSLRREIAELRSEVARLDRELHRQRAATERREFRDTIRRQTWFAIAAMYSIAAVTWGAIVLTG